MRCNPWRWLWGILPLAVWTWVTVLVTHGRVEDDLMLRAHLALERAGLGWAQPALSGRDATITGEAVEEGDPARAADIVQQVTGVRTAEVQANLIEKVDVYRWGAGRHDGGIRLTGHVPNQETRRKVIGLVKAAFPKAAVDDEMKLARGAPARDAWLGGISFALKQLAGLKSGHAELTGMDVAVAGEAADAASFEAVRGALHHHLPGGVKLGQDGVSPPVVAPYTWGANWAGREVSLRGFVPSEAARAALNAKAKSLFSSATVVDRTAYGSGAPDGFEEAARGALESLAGLKEGHADINATHVELAGLASDEATAAAVRHAMKKGLSGKYKLSEQLTWLKPVVVEAPVVDDTAARRAAEEARAKREAEESAEAKRRAEESAETKRRAEEARANREAEAAAEAKRDSEAAEIETRRRAAAVEINRCQSELTSILNASQIRFERASAAIEHGSQPTLDKLARVAGTCPKLRIEIGGHTDAEGAPDRNQRLSERRAQAVVAYLANAGVAGERLRAVGYGETKPVAPNDTAESRAMNRRIEFVVRSNEQ